MNKHLLTETVLKFFLCENYNDNKTTNVHSNDQQFVYFYADQRVWV